MAVPVYEFSGLIGVNNLSNLFSFSNLTSTSGYLIEWSNPWWTGIGSVSYDVVPSSVPVPGAVWLFGSALAGIVARSRRSA
ncbi:PEP-CTERM sorting domain-containing protein [Methylomonas sp. 11b]|uniref:PEP-CTERM sorting domain-containing protein n=1 Tax=Methylomonas sp. 11b TaxID=1168169 RepID=UPI003FA5556E